MSNQVSDDGDSGTRIVEKLVDCNTRNEVLVFLDRQVCQHLNQWGAGSPMCCSFCGEMFFNFTGGMRHDITAHGLDWRKVVDSARRGEQFVLQTKDIQIADWHVAVHTSDEEKPEWLEKALKNGSATKTHRTVSL